MFERARILFASYNLDLAKEQTGRLKNIMRSPEYHDVFPHISLGGKTGFDQADRFDVDGSGYFKCGGLVGGGFTGRGANYIIVDDPIKGVVEANSETTREAVKQSMNGNILTRRGPNTKLMLIQTCWHEDDLAGYLEKDGRFHWHVVFVQAQRDRDAQRLVRLRNNPNVTVVGEDEDPREDGEYLWESHYGRDYYETAKADRRTWSALYQQSPMIEGGDIFRSEWFRYWTPSPKDPDKIEWGEMTYDLKHMRLFGVMDCAFSEKEANKADPDYTVLLACAATGDGRVVVLGRDKRRIESPDAAGMIRENVQRWGLREVFVETDGGGITAFQHARRAGLPVRRISTRVEDDGKKKALDKEARARIVTPYVENGQVALPQGAAWVADYLETVCAFPNGAHDDDVDGTIYMCNVAFHNVLNGFVSISQERKRWDGSGQKPSANSNGRKWSY